MAEQRKSGGKGGGKSDNEGPGAGVFGIIAAVAAVIFVVLFMAIKAENRGKLDLPIPEAISVESGREYLETAKIIWQNFVSPVVILLDLLVLGLFIYSLIRAWPLRPRLALFEGAPEKSAPNRPKVAVAGWQKVLARKASKTADDLRLAIIEADALVDDFLKQAGYSGENMADRLSQIIPGEVKSIERVWRAHRLRNNLVHAPASTLRPAEAEEAIDAFHDFLRELDGL